MRQGRATQLTGRVASGAAARRVIKREAPDELIAIASSRFNAAQRPRSHGRAHLAPPHTITTHTHIHTSRNASHTREHVVTPSECAARTSVPHPSAPRAAAPKEATVHARGMHLPARTLLTVCRIDA